MSGVEALEQTTTDGQVMPAEQTTEAPSQSIEEALDGIWDRAYVTNGADRGEDGKFKSTKEPEGGAVEQETTAEAEGQAEKAASLEGEMGEGQEAGSTPTEVPLPANWTGKEALWNAIPAEHRAELAQHQQELHTRLSDMGRQVSQYKPLQEAAAEFAEYFNGNLKGADGQPINPADGIRYLANIQRAMDTNPKDTLLSIAETYGLSETLAKHFGGQVQSVPADQKVLLNEIAELKRTISGLRDPANIEQVLEKRELNNELSRFAESKPLWSQVENDLPFFINKAKTQLGESAGRTAILEKAYDLAVQADPALRAQLEAAKPAAEDKSAAKAEAAKRANGVNVTSTSSGKAKEPTLDQKLEAIWEKTRKA